MKARQHLGALLLSLATFGACVPSRTSMPIPDGIPDSIYIGREIGYSLGGMIGPFTQLLRMTGEGPLGADSLMSIQIYHSEIPGENERIFHMLTEEEFPDYPNLNPEESDQYAARLYELFPIKAQYLVCPPLPLSATRPLPVPEGWTPIDHNGVTHIVHVDPFIVSRRDAENGPEILLSRNNNGIISDTQYDPNDTYEFFCPSSDQPRLIQPPSRPIPAP